VALPTDAKVYSGNYLHTLTVVNSNPYDVAITWRAYSSTTGLIDSGTVTIPSMNVQDVTRSYSYQTVGTETIVYNIFDLDGYQLDTRSGSFYIAQSATLQSALTKTYVAPTTTPMVETPWPFIWLSPASGPPGSQFTIRGSSFTPSATFKASDILSSVVASTGSNTYAVDGAGNISISCSIIANCTIGSHTIVVKDPSGKSALAIFTVYAPPTTVPPTTPAPTLTLTPSSAVQGSQLTVSGRNFTPYGTVKATDILWNGISSIGSNTYTIDGSGYVTITFTIPADYPVRT
jgi:hypothetical protein